MTRPRCPNHQCSLDPTNNPRIGICPISGYRFEVDVDANETEVRHDKFGRPMQTYTLKPLDGQGG